MNIINQQCVPNLFTITYADSYVEIEKHRCQKVLIQSNLLVAVENVVISKSDQRNKVIHKEEHLAIDYSLVQE
jgi:hypothetical protein